MATADWRSGLCAPGDPARRIAIVLDDDVISSPQVDPSIGCGVGIPPGGPTSITGQFTEGEAKDLALLVRAGALPVPVEIVEQRTIGPTLGEAAISASIEAAVIGAALTVLFLLAYYRFLGVLAAIALGVYGLVSLAALQAIDATLTLPGIAGFVLAIGMAVDGNVLVFERIKEEHARGRSLRAAGRSGFKRAWSAIADSNVTTLIAAVVLYFFAAGGVRGFGITVSIGVLASMFTALVVTRLLIEVSSRSRRLQARPNVWGMRVGTGLREWIAAKRPDLVKRRVLWFTISGVMVVLASVGIGTRGLNYGLEFTGGRLIEYRSEVAVDLDVVRSELADIGLARAVVQESGDGNVAVRTRELDADEEEALDDTMRELVGGAERLRDEFVGPTIGAELPQRALTALGLALAAQLLYLAIRFRWTYGVSSVAAMAQNVVILVGVFAWLGKEFDGVFVAALLTVIGYAINDAVVIFDRVREHVVARPRDHFATVANDAALETLPRTVNTGLSTPVRPGRPLAAGCGDACRLCPRVDHRHRRRDHVISADRGTAVHSLGAQQTGTRESAEGSSRAARRLPAGRRGPAPSQEGQASPPVPGPARVIPPRPRKKRGGRRR